MIDRNYFLKNGRAGDLWILARYLYRIGEEPILSDREYDKLTRLFEEKYREPFKEYLDRTYDDDPIPYALLQEVGLRPYIPVRKDGREELYDISSEFNNLLSNNDEESFSLLDYLVRRCSSLFGNNRVSSVITEEDFDILSKGLHSIVIKDKDRKNIISAGLDGLVGTKPIDDSVRKLLKNFLELDSITVACIPIIQKHCLKTIKTDIGEFQFRYKQMVWW